MSPRLREARTLAALAAPVVLTQVATMLLGVVDTLMVARLGTEAMAATALGHVWVFGTIVLAMGVLLGIDPVVSQAHGAGEGARAGLALQRALVLSLALSLPVALLWSQTGPILVALGQPPDLARVSHVYALVQIPSIPCFLAFTALRQYLTGRGIVAPAMWVAWAANGVNVLFNWALIYGHLGLPRLEVAGAGIATALSRAFQLALLALLVVRGGLHRGAWPGWSRRALAPSGLRELLAIGVPVAVQVGLEVWAFQVATLLAGRLGSEALAAHTIALNLASLTFMLPLGVSIAAATRVGNLIGAGRPLPAQRAAGVALAMGAGVMALCALAILLLRAELPRLWAPAPGVARLAALVLPVAAAFQVFDGTQAVGCGVLRGMGDTRPAAWFNLLGYYGLALPLGGWLAFGRGHGLLGLWWGLTLGLAAVALLLVARIRRRGPAALARTGGGGAGQAPPAANLGPGAGVTLER